MNYELWHMTYELWQIPFNPRCPAHGISYIQYIQHILHHIQQTTVTNPIWPTPQTQIHPIPVNLPAQRPNLPQLAHSMRLYSMMSKP